MKRFLRDNGLSLALFSLFFACQIVPTISGHLTHNSDQQEHGQPTLTYTEYLHSSDYVEATVENWESEFLEMFSYVLLTAFLSQRGSAESKDPDAGDKELDRNPRSNKKPNSPWPVRRGGWMLRVYENSLSLALFSLFACSLSLHAVSGAHNYSEEQLSHGQRAVTVAEYVVSSRFWFESMQNWQSEFFGIGTMVVLSVFLRQRGSPESKPVDAPNRQTGA